MGDLSTGKAVRREGDHVHRPHAPWTPAVRALLGHLHAAGFDGAPRPVVTPDDGHDVVTWVEGDVEPAAVLEGGQMAALGALLRRLHDTTASFPAGAAGRWQPSVLRPFRGDDVVGHGDVAPWNLVSRDGVPVALIDWELAGPVDQLRELGHAAWLCGGLYDDGTVSEAPLPPVAQRAANLRRFADGYGLPREERPGLVEAMIDVAILTAASDAREAGIGPDGAAGSFGPWGVAWRSRSAAWMVTHRPRLLAALLA
jgi:aminoglycoside phosphotransferase (APT) family kinase protein